MQIPKPVIDSATHRGTWVPPVALAGSTRTAIFKWSSLGAKKHIYIYTTNVSIQSNGFGVLEKSKDVKSICVNVHSLGLSL